MAQVLKSEIREKILQSALNGFYKNGYGHTSMKEIAKGAGITVGNIYNYFKNKEELLSTLIAPVLEQINALFEMRITDPAMMNIAGVIEMSQRKMETFIRIYLSNQKVFVMVFEKNGGMEFDINKQDVVEHFSTAMIRNKSKILGMPSTQEQKIFMKAFARSYVEGVISILSEQTTEEIKIRVLQDYLPFMRDELVKRICGQEDAV